MNIKKSISFALLFSFAVISGCGGSGSGVGVESSSVHSAELLGIGNEGGAVTPTPTPSSPSNVSGMVSFSGGTFTMGWNDSGNSNNPEHSVTLSGFRIDKTEVTQSQYQSVMGNNPSYNAGCSDCPVESVTWQEAVDYCSAVGKRLPTEAEWEYAARNGGTAPVDAYSNGSTSTPGCSSGNIVYAEFFCVGSTSNVGSYAASSSGLYDMMGNVWEWTGDWYANNYYANGQTNPTGPGAGTFRVVRGGSWNVFSGGLRASFRYGGTTPAARSNFFLGFRCASN